MDSTVKPLYGHQEGAEIGYNPRKPGRPSHAYHTYFLSNLRLVLRVDVLPGDAYNVSNATDGLWKLLDHLGPARRPALLRGDASWGIERDVYKRQIGYCRKPPSTTLTLPVARGLSVTRPSNYG